MNPLKLITDYLDKAKSHIYGIFAFWLVIFNLPIIFTALFIDQNLVYRQTGLLKNEYIRSTYLNIHSWENMTYELVSLALAVALTYLMIWVLPKTIIAKAYGRELQDQYERESQKLTKDRELEKKKQELADNQLKTATKAEEVVKKQDDLEQIERGQWDKEFIRFSKSGLANVMPSIANVIYGYKGHISRFYEQPGGWQDPQIREEDLAIAHSNSLIELSTADNTISLTEKGKYFLSQSYYDNLP